eukprot:403359825
MNQDQLNNQAYQQYMQQQQQFQQNQQFYPGQQQQQFVPQQQAQQANNGNPFMNQYGDSTTNTTGYINQLPGGVLPQQQQYQQYPVQNGSYQQNVQQQPLTSFDYNNATFGSSYEQPVINQHNFQAATENLQQQQVQIDTSTKGKKRGGVLNAMTSETKKKKRSNSSNIWNSKSRKASQRAQKLKRDKIRNEQGLVGQQANLIDQINTLNINGSTSRSRIRKPRDQRQMQVDPSRVNPVRATKTEKKDYNETKMSQINIEQFPKPAKESKPELEKMQVEDKDSFDPNNPYEKIILNQNTEDEDIQCDVCLEFDHEDEDQIVICDLCNVAVHQSCYGGDIINQIPVGNWYCERCTILVRNREMKCDSIKCKFCPDVDGAMKKLVDSDMWAHVICVNWNPDIYFTDKYKNKIEGVLNSKRYELQCNMCHRPKAQGCCIQCDFKNCSASYHVRCAVRRGVIEEWDKIQEKAGVEDEHFIPLFCEEHAEKGYKIFKENGKQGIQSITQTPEYKQKLAERMRQKAQLHPGKFQKKQKVSLRKPVGKTLNFKNGINLGNKKASKAIQDVVNRISSQRDSRNSKSKVKNGKKSREGLRKREIPRPQHNSIGKQSQLLKSKKKIIASSARPSRQIQSSAQNHMPAQNHMSAQNQFDPNMLAQFSQFFGQMMGQQLNSFNPNQFQSQLPQKQQQQSKPIPSKTKTIGKGNQKQQVPIKNQQVDDEVMEDTSSKRPSPGSFLKKHPRTKKQLSNKAASSNQNQNSTNSSVMAINNLYPQAPFNPYLGTPMINPGMFGSGQALPKPF